MRIAHFILAHNDPAQLERLIVRLSYADDSIYIHLDKKTPIGPFEYLKKLPNVHFVEERVKVKWGAYSIVAATINGFKEIIKKAGKYDFVNLLSGADYPLQSPEDIHRFLSENTGKIFMSYMPILEEWQEALPRITNYHFNEYTFPGVFQVQSLVNSTLPPRKMPDGMIAVGHSQWFTASMESIAHIVSYWDKNAHFRRFIKFTWGPDEFVFQTILYNSHLRSQMVNNNLRYIDWSTGGASPKTFTTDDTKVLLASDKLYARKFNLDASAEVLKAIDQKLLPGIMPENKLVSA